MVVKSISIDSKFSSDFSLRQSKYDFPVLTSQIELWWTANKIGKYPIKIFEISAPESGGVANETLFLAGYYVDDNNNEVANADLVLRLEGEEFLYPEADLALHYEMYNRLNDVGNVPVPKMLAFETDVSVLGTRFMLMQRVPGHPIPDRPNFNFGGWLHDMPSKARELVWHEAVATMAELHQVNPSGFLHLQKNRTASSGLSDCLDYWRRYAQWCKGNDVDLIRIAGDWLLSTLPKRPETHDCISWGDARLQNLMFEGTRCTALLDWDMVSLAGAEADLAWWTIADHKNTASRGMARLAGIGSPKDTMNLWESITGRKLMRMDWHLAFAAYRQALVSLRLMDLYSSSDLDTTRPRAPSIGMQWLSHFLEIPLGTEITLPFVGLDK